jgi:choline dehydrogenase-like flavoprotein
VNDQLAELTGMGSARSADFVIVGAGSAGCTLAARLTEDPSVEVILVEAGGPASGDIFTVPAFWGRQLTSQYDWDYLSEPEPGFDSRRNFLPRGKVLGGTSSMNAMLYVRGSRGDFDGWEALGASGWGWEDVLPYFKKAEANEHGASELHGGEGPLHVSDRRSGIRVIEAWVESAVAAGYRANPDFNGPDQEGVGFYQLTTRAGERCSAAVAYLDPARGRPNLDVITHAHATRLRFEGGRVSGVQVDRLGALEELHAREAVVLSAGAYNTPQILMHSGIGPAEHLASFEIDVVGDLPVGENLQDHPGVPLVMSTEEATLFGVGSDADWERYRESRSGRLASNIVEAGGFFRTTPGLAECDVQMICNASTFSEDARGPVVRDGFTVVIEVTRPTSVGAVRLRSLVPTSKPRVTHNHLSSSEDWATMLRGMELAIEILGHSPIADLTSGRMSWPASDGEDELRAFARANGLGTFHPSSTCAIGTVVDSELRVLGIDGLRIADASVMPTTIGGNPNAAVIMIAERLADIVLAGAGKEETASHARR